MMWTFFFFSKYLWLSGFAFCARVLNVASSLYNMHPPFGKLALLLLLWRRRQSPSHLVFTHMVSTLHRNVISSRTQNLTISILQSKDVFLTCTNPHQDQCNIFVRVRNKWRMHHLFFQGHLRREGIISGALAKNEQDTFPFIHHDCRYILYFLCAYLWTLFSWRRHASNWGILFLSCLSFLRSYFCGPSPSFLPLSGGFLVWARSLFVFPCYNNTIWCERMNVTLSFYNMHPPFGNLALLLLLWRCRQSTLHLVFPWGAPSYSPRSCTIISRISQFENMTLPFQRHIPSPAPISTEINATFLRGSGANVKMHPSFFFLSLCYATKIYGMHVLEGKKTRLRFSSKRYFFRFSN